MCDSFLDYLKETLETKSYLTRNETQLFMTIITVHYSGMYLYILYYIGN